MPPAERVGRFDNLIITKPRRHNYLDENAVLMFLRAFPQFQNRLRITIP
jgi:hypothetical protein